MLPGDRRAATKAGRRDGARRNPSVPTRSLAPQYAVDPLAHHLTHPPTANTRSTGPAAPNPLVTAPILPTLLRFALPNMAAMLATALATVAETGYVGSLGTAALAGMALAFPMVMLQQMMSAGAMGGGVSSAVSRALGAGDQDRANALTVHATCIGAGAVARARKVAWTAGALAFGTLTTFGVVLALMPDLWGALFSRDPAVLRSAAVYFMWSGPCYGVLGMGLSLYFSSLGAGHALGPVLAGTLRLAVVAAGAWVLTTFAAPVWSVFALVGFGMLVYGLATALAVHRANWSARR